MFGRKRDKYGMRARRRQEMLENIATGLCIGALFGLAGLVGLAGHLANSGAF